MFTRNKNPKSFMKKAILCFFLGLFMFVNSPIVMTNALHTEKLVAHAEEPSSDAMKEEASKILVFESVLNRILWPMLILIGGLMDNSILFGGGMEETLREIWVPIRNIVNIFFVLALVGLAIYNVLGIAEDNSALKTLLPKIIIGIIAVNFSFLGMKVFLDMVNVLTTSIFALPIGMGTTGTKDISDETIEGKICAGINGLKYSNASTLPEAELTKTIEVRVASMIATEIMGKNVTGATVADIKAATGDKQAQFETRWTSFKTNKICEGLKIQESKKAWFKDFNSNNAALALAINTGNILSFSDISVGDIEGKPEQLLIGIIFSVLMYLIFAVSFVALFAVLLGRLAFMWVAVALSPVLVIAMFVPVVKEKFKSFGELSEKFVANAIAPIPIAFALTIGWIMLNAIKNTSGLSSASGYSPLDAGFGIPVVGLSTLQDLIASIGTLAVVWMGVFGATSGTVAEPFTNALKGAAEGFGKFIGTAPFRFLPLVPIKVPGKDGEPEKYSLSAVMEFAKQKTNEWSRGDDRLIKDMGGTSAPNYAAARTVQDLAKEMKRTDVIADLRNGSGISHLKGFQTSAAYKDIRSPQFDELVKRAISEEEASKGSSRRTQAMIADMLEQKGGRKVGNEVIDGTGIAETRTKPDLTGTGGAAAQPKPTPATPGAVPTGAATAAATAQPGGGAPTAPVTGAAPGPAQPGAAPGPAETGRPPAPGSRAGVEAKTPIPGPDTIRLGNGTVVQKAGLDQNGVAVYVDGNRGTYTINGQPYVPDNIGNLDIGSAQAKAAGYQAKPRTQPKTTVAPVAGTVPLSGVGTPTIYDHNGGQVVKVGDAYYPVTGDQVNLGAPVTIQPGSPQPTIRKTPQAPAQ